MHTLQKYEPDSVCLIAYPAEIQTEFWGRFCNPCRNANRIADKVLHTLQKSKPDHGHKIPTWQKYEPDSGQGFAYPAKVQTESQAYNSDLGKRSTESQACFPDLWMTCPRSGKSEKYLFYHQPTALGIFDTVMYDELPLLVGLELELPDDETRCLVQLSATEFLGGDGDVGVLRDGNLIL